MTSVFLLRRTHGGATTTVPDATQPPSICQNLAGERGGFGVAWGGGLAGGGGGGYRRYSAGGGGGCHGVSLGCTKGAEQGPKA